MFNSYTGPGQMPLLTLLKSGPALPGLPLLGEGCRRRILTGFCVCLFDCVTVVHSKQVSARLGINYDSVRALRRGGLLRSFHVKELPYHSGSGPKFVKRPLSLITYAKLSLPVTRGVVVVGCNFPPFPGPRQAPCKLGGPVGEEATLEKCRSPLTTSLFIMPLLHNLFKCSVPAVDVGLDIRSMIRVLLLSVSVLRCQFFKEVHE